MGRLFLFCIGGTGSRILRSLLHLMANGLVLNCNSLVPIIIDPDISNGDLNRTISLLRRYRTIRSSLENFDNHNFFKTKIETIADLAVNPDMQNVDDFRFALNGVDDTRFREFLGLNNFPHNNANREFIETLFSRTNLDSTMEVGFKGNPNIGSVVLNQIVDNDSFHVFEDAFGEDDKVFVASSIFGGTGAAGYPLIVKNIREHENQHIRNCILGGLTVLPYFGLNQNEDSEINSNSFITKAKSALQYYRSNLHTNDIPRINAQFYLGLRQVDNLNNVEGGEHQQNSANFVELSGALSIFHFLQIENQNTENGVAINPTYYEYGVDGDQNQQYNLFNLNNQFSRIATTQMAKFGVLSYLLENYLMEASRDSNLTWVNNGPPGMKLNSDFFQSFWIQELQNFNNDYRKWLLEMRDNGIKFYPFDMDVGKERALSCLLGINRSNGNILSRLLVRNDINIINDKLNISEQEMLNLNKVEDKFLSVFDIGLTTALNSVYNTDFN